MAQMADEAPQAHGRRTSITRIGEMYDPKYFEDTTHSDDQLTWTTHLTWTTGLYGLTKRASLTSTSTSTTRCCRRTWATHRSRTTWATRGCHTTLATRAVGDFGNAALSHDFGSAASGYPLAGANVTPYFFPVGFGSGPLGVPSSSRLADELDDLSGSRDDSETWRLPPHLGFIEQGTQDLGFEHAGPAEQKESRNKAGSAPFVQTARGRIAQRHACLCVRVTTALPCTQHHRYITCHAGNRNAWLEPARTSNSDLQACCVGTKRSSPLAHPPMQPVAEPSPTSAAPIVRTRSDTPRRSRHRHTLATVRPGRYHTDAPVTDSAGISSAGLGAPRSPPVYPDLGDGECPEATGLEANAWGNGEENGAAGSGAGASGSREGGGATAPKPGDVQLANPASNDYNLVVVVPAERPRRQIIPRRIEAAEDAQLLEALKGSNAGDKRKAEEKAGPATAKRQALLRSFWAKKGKA
ncbi:hypothetical protein B0H13DRAFT_2379940 [Mycena leptocephala]|nr:hypothetical protein B0H13DRAFT_2379940 [Mycena leptocephala]